MTYTAENHVREQDFSENQHFSEEQPEAGEARHVGRAQVRPPQPEPAPRTSVLPVAPVPPPVFVDPTGRRRRTLYLMAAGVVVAILTGVLGVWLGLFAGSVAPAPVLTCPAGTASTSCAPR